MFLQKFEEETYALMRIMSGFLFLWHGAQKLLAFPAPSPYDPPPFVVYIAGPIELFGGILIVIGLFTRWSAFVCSGLGAAAYWMAHGTKNFFPLLNGGELAAFYCFVFLFIAARGAGIQLWVRFVLRWHSTELPNLPGTGGELAVHLLKRFELVDVTVEETESGRDHYDPGANVVCLSPEVYQENP